MIHRQKRRSWRLCLRCMSPRLRLMASLPGRRRRACCLSSCAVGHAKLPVGRSPVKSEPPCAYVGPKQQLRKASETWDAVKQGGWGGHIRQELYSQGKPPPHSREGARAALGNHHPGTLATYWMSCLLLGAVQYPQPSELMRMWAVIPETWHHHQQKLSKPSDFIKTKQPHGSHCLRIRANHLSLFLTHQGLSFLSLP